MGKRILLLVVTNVLVMTMLTVVIWGTGLYRYTDANGINLPMVSVLALVIGFGGSFISLAISKWAAKMAFGVHVIDPANPGDPTSAWIVQTVHDHSRKAGLTKMPEVGVYQAEELNAFATGATKNSSLVAVSTGLINNMERGAVSAVIGHEVTHISNGDMVTMALVQGVVNTFVVFFSRVLAFLISSRIRGNSAWIVRFACIIVFQIAFSALGYYLVVAPFSRWREFRADRGGAHLGGADNMIAALETLKMNKGLKMIPQDAYATAQISGRFTKWNFGATHPDLDLRIERLRELKNNPTV